MLDRYVLDEMCAVQGVEKLQPGTCADFRPDGTCRIERYWDVVEEAAAALESDYDLREVIEASVSAHLVSDVPVSSFSFGGLDSSIVTVLAKRANPQIDAYTITFRAEDDIVSRRCRTMPCTPGRSPGAMGSNCMKLRSSQTWSNSCPGWSKSSTNPRAIRLPSTRSSCRMERARRG